MKIDVKQKAKVFSNTLAMLQEILPALNIRRLAEL
jgi:hypothetical protein